MTDGERYERGQAIVREVEREFAGRPMQEMVEEVRARIEKVIVMEGGAYSQYLMKPLEAQPERVSEPVVTMAPERAFPDDWYYRPVITEEQPPVRVYEQPSNQVMRWLNYKPESQTYKEQYERWFAPRDCVSYPGQFCQCGHPFEEHAPACVHLIEGCGCEGFLKVPQGVVEGT